MLNAFKKLQSEKQQIILNAAAGIFAKKGYEAASISDICRKANISNGALYKYFKNKEAVFHAVADHGIELMIEEYYAKYTTEAGSVVDSVRDLLHGLKEFTKKYRDYVSIYSDLGSSSMNHFARYISERIEHEGRSFFIALIEDGKKRGEIDKRIRSDIAAYFIDSYLTLYSYSLVSEHHNRRFDGFFRNSAKRLTEDDKIKIIMESLSLILQR